jgi:Flp pilus assembly protein TadG
MKRQFIRINSRTARRSQRRAAAAVEFAVVLPLLMAVMLGIMEYGRLFMVRQTMTHAAREGARIAMLQTTDAPYTEVTDRITEVMNPTGLTGYSVSMVHATTEDPTETITLSIGRRRSHLGQLTDRSRESGVRGQ